MTEEQRKYPPTFGPPPQGQKPYYECCRNPEPTDSRSETPTRLFIPYRSNHLAGLSSVIAYLISLPGRVRDKWRELLAYDRQQRRAIAEFARDHKDDV